MAGSLGLTLCLCLCFWRTHCQILQAPADPETGYLDLTEYPLPANFGGVFTYPTSVTQVYDEGVPTTIAWNTTYQHISLYVAYVRNISLAAPVDGAGNSQRQLQTNTPSDSSDTFSWVASCAPDCDAPYQLHIVNSHGSSREVTQEGFWSDYFWIRASSRPETETSTTSTDTSTATSATSTTTTASSSISYATSTTSTQTPPPTSGTVSPSPVPTETGSNGLSDSQSPSPAATESSGLSTGVIVGISIGAAALVLCTIALGVFYCLMKKHRGEKISRDAHASYERDTKNVPTYYAMSPQRFSELDAVQPMNQTPTELAATQSPTELGATRWR